MFGNVKTEWVEIFSDLNIVYGTEYSIWIILSCSVSVSKPLTGRIIKAHSHQAKTKILFDVCRFFLHSDRHQRRFPLGSVLFYYRPQGSCGQGNIFTPVCHSVHRGGCLPQCMVGYHHRPLGADPPDQGDPPGTRQTPPRTRQTPQDQADPLGPGRQSPWDQADTPPGTR